MQKLSVALDYPQPIFALQTNTQETIVRHLPHELFEHILSFLNREDRQATLGVDHCWQQATRVATKVAEYALLDEFLLFVLTRLNESECASQIAQLKTIGSTKRPLGPEHLFAIKASLKCLGEKIINVIMELEPETRKSLFLEAQNEGKPLFFSTIFQLSDDYQYIKVVFETKNPEGLRELTALVKSSKQLRNRDLINSLIEKLLTYAKRLDVDKNKEFHEQAINTIVSFSSGFVDRDLDIMLASKHTDVLLAPLMKSWPLDCWGVFEAARKGEIKTATELANNIQDQDLRDLVLLLDVCNLVERNHHIEPLIGLFNLLSEKKKSLCLARLRERSCRAEAQQIEKLCS